MFWLLLVWLSDTETFPALFFCWLFLPREGGMVWPCNARCLHLASRRHAEPKSRSCRVLDWKWRLNSCQNCLHIGCSKLVGASLQGSLHSWNLGLRAKRFSLTSAAPQSNNITMKGFSHFLLNHLHNQCSMGNEQKSSSSKDHLLSFEIGLLLLWCVFLGRVQRTSSVCRAVWSVKRSSIWNVQAYLASQIRPLWKSWYCLKLVSHLDAHQGRPPRHLQTTEVALWFRAANEPD